MSEIFISYARSTAAKAQQIAEALRGLGYGVWRDDDLPAHKPYAEVIEERLGAAKAVVVIWSSDAVKSQWVFSEANRARESGKLVQLSLETLRLPMPFDSIQCADLAGWTGDFDAHDWKKVVASVADLVGAARPAAAVAPAATPRRLSICVLPFVNMSGEAEQEYFSDGISEDIITDLSKVSALSVVARNTAFTFKGKNVKVPEVARELAVSHVLEGSVRKAGGRVRITAQLIDGAAGDHVWAERYDRNLDDIFALQDEISEAIVAALKLKLLPDEKRAIEKRGTTNAQAYDLYLMARQISDQSNGDLRRYQMIERLCERAVGLDPGYARAWTLLASSKDTMAHVLTYGEDGEAETQRALELDANLAEAHALRAKQLYRAGRRDEWFGELEIALRLDPYSADVNDQAGQIYYRDRRFGEAAVHLEKAVELNDRLLGPAMLLVAAHTALGNPSGAREAAKVALQRAEAVVAEDPGNGFAIGSGVTALACLGQAARAHEWIDRALLLDPGNSIMRYNLACTLTVFLGDVDRAIELLRSALAYDPAGDLLGVARTDPDLDPIRGDARFEPMMTEAEARLAAAKSA